MRPYYGSVKLRDVVGHDDYTYWRSVASGTFIMMRVHYGVADECPGRPYVDVCIWDGPDV